MLLRNCKRPSEQAWRDNRGDSGQLKEAQYQCSSAASSTGEERMLDSAI